MRPRAAHAALSGVGEHTARESERAQCVPMGKSAWRAPTPKFGPGTARFRGLIVFARDDFEAFPSALFSHGFSCGRGGSPGPKTPVPPLSVLTMRPPRRFLLAAASFAAASFASLMTAA